MNFLKSIEWRRKGNFLIKIFSVIFSIFIVIIILYLIYLRFTYIDKLVEQGEAYGFCIGDSKKDSYQKARQIFAGEKVYILYPLDSNNFGPHKEFYFFDNEYQMIADRKIWTFYFNDGFFDFIKLSFNNDVLSSIHRHRKKFELP